MVLGCRMRRNALSGIRDEAMFWPYATFFVALHGVLNIQPLFQSVPILPGAHVVFNFPKINRRLEV